MKNIGGVVDKLSDLIADRLAEVKFWNPREISPIIHAFLVTGLQDCLDIKINSIEEEILKLENIRKDEPSSKKRHELQLQIGSLRVQKKHYNRVGTDVQSLTKYQSLVCWVKEIYGEDAIKEFYKKQNEVSQNV